jgi:hypothetical protein
MAESVTFHIGPVPSDIAAGWLANSRALVAGVRTNERQLSINVHDELLDLCEVLLDVWQVHATKSEIFDWSMSTSTETVVQVVGQWLEIGSLSDDELTLMGCGWAPDWTRPFADALVVGASAALVAAGPRGEPYLRRIEGA